MSIKKGEYPRWREYYHLKYCLYVILYSHKQNHEDPNLNRRGKFYKGIARWLRNDMTAQQCRTHHKKQLQRFNQSIDQMKNAFLENLYFIRRIEIQHLWTEVKHHLEWLAEKKMMSLAEEEEAKKNARDIIALYQKQILPLQRKKQLREKQGQSLPQQCNAQSKMEQDKALLAEQGQSIFLEQKVQGAASDSMLFLAGQVDVECFYNSMEHQY